MLKRAVSTMPKLFFVVSAIWWLLAQAMLIVSLWDSDSDQPELFHSRVLHWALGRVWSVFEMGLVPSIAVGLLLLATVLVIRNGRNGWCSITDVVWVGSGMACTLVFLLGGLFIYWGEPDYYAPPPRLPQIACIAIVIALDVMLGIAIRRLVRKHRAAT